MKTRQENDHALAQKLKNKIFINMYIGLKFYKSEKYIIAAYEIIKNRKKSI